MLSKAFQYVADPNMPASKKAEGAGKFVGGALVAGVGLAAMGKLPGGKLAGKAGRGILGGAGKFAAKAGGGSKLKGAGRIAKVAGGVMGAVAIYEQAPSIAKNSAKLINKYGEMSLKEMNDTGFNIASSFTSILNAMFLGIPGMISKSLGIGKKDFQNFYDSLVMQAEGWMLKAIMIFDLAIEGGKYAFERFKITSMEVFWTIAEVGGGALLGVIERFVKGLEIAQGVFNELHKSSKNFFEGFKMGGKMMLLNLTASFTGFKQTVVFDVLAPIVQAIEQFVVSQIITIQKIARKIPRGLLPASAEAFLGMNASEFGFTKGTMFDAKLIEDARKKSSEQLAEERARIVGDYEAAVSANNSAQGVTMASKMAENLSIMQGQLRGVAYYNKRNLESRRADLERNTGANVQGIGSAYLSGVGASEREFNANYLARSNPASVTPVASVKQTRAVAPQAALGVPAADDTPVVEMNRKGFATIASATTESGKAIVDAINRLGKRKEDSEDGGLF